MHNFWNFSGGAKILLAMCAAVLLAEGVYINYVMGGNLVNLFASGTSCERVLEKWAEAHPEEAKDRAPYAGTIASVNWDTPLARAKEFKTAIEEGVEKGANFAGKFVVAQWGCGEGCQNHAIVNVESGKIITIGPRSEAGVGIAPESNILIVNPKENFPPLSEMQKATLETRILLANMSREYYVLEGDGDNSRLQKLCTENPFEGSRF